MNNQIQTGVKTKTTSTVAVTLGLAAVSFVAAAIMLVGMDQFNQEIDSLGESTVKNQVDLSKLGLQREEIIKVYDLGKVVTDKDLTPEFLKAQEDYWNVKLSAVVTVEDLFDEISQSELLKIMIRPGNETYESCCKPSSPVTNFLPLYDRETGTWGNCAGSCTANTGGWLERYRGGDNVRYTAEYNKEGEMIELYF